MLLAEYIKKNKIDVQAFAEELMICLPYMNAVIRGYNRPSKRLAARIESATEGKVTAYEIYTSTGPLRIKCPYCNQYVKEKHLSSKNL